MAALRAMFTSKLGVQCFRRFSDKRVSLEKGINQVILLGRCGSDAQMRGSDTKSVVLFSLATHTNYKSQATAQYEQKTEWHRISVFRNGLQQKVLDYAKKGSRVLVQGKLSYGEITDANGNLHQTTSIIADDIIFFSASRVVANEAEEEEEHSMNAQ